jgi:hypothetical protein
VAGIFSNVAFSNSQSVPNAATNTYFEISEFTNSLHTVTTYEIFDGGCITTSGDASLFKLASNIISTLSGGKLKAEPNVTSLARTYNICIKVTDDAGFSENKDGLSLTV